MSNPRVSIFRKWVVGLGLSLFAIWAITAISTENLFPRIWVPELGRNLPAAGWSHHYRGESWARSDFGELGLAGIEDVRAVSLPKVFIWGDSFIQAAHVDDDRKVHAAVTGLLADDGGTPLSAISIGQNWWSLPDYFFRIPDYERAVAGCRLHVIHLFTLEDTLPDRYPGARTSLFLSDPDFRFEKYDNEYREIEAPAKTHPLKNAAYRARLQFFLRMRTRFLEVARLEGLRFRPGTQNSSRNALAKDTLDWDELKQPDWISQEIPSDAWRYGLESLSQVTEVPILFVYAPMTPRLDGGKVLEENAERDMADAFADACREVGHGFVSLEKPFLDYWLNTGNLPRGFPTSRPGEGHYNAEGHRLVAEAIHGWIRQNAHVVHPD